MNPRAEAPSNEAKRVKKDYRTLFWLIVAGTEEDGASPLSVDLPGEGEGALAVFSFAEEAQAYLRTRAPEGHWRVEEVEPEELVSMLLSGTCSCVGRVALDPMPELSAHLTIGLVGVSREAFLNLLSSAPGRPRTPPASVGASAGSGTDFETRRRFSAYTRGSPSSWWSRI